jgi:hypothetical protein
MTAPSRKERVLAARKLRAYWHSRGFRTAEFWVEPNGSGWVVKSNLVAGRPQRLWAPRWSTIGVNAGAGKEGRT